MTFYLYCCCLFAHMQSGKRSERSSTHGGSAKEFVFDHSYWSVNKDDNHFVEQEKVRSSSPPPFLATSSSLSHPLPLLLLSLALPLFTPLPSFSLPRYSLPRSPLSLSPSPSFYFPRHSLSHLLLSSSSSFTPLPLLSHPSSPSLTTPSLTHPLSSLPCTLRYLKT